MASFAETQSWHYSWLYGRRKSDWGQSGVQLRPLGWEFRSAKPGFICQTLQTNVLCQGLVTDGSASAACSFPLFVAEVNLCSSSLCSFASGVALNPLVKRVLWGNPEQKTDQSNGRFIGGFGALLQTVVCGPGEVPWMLQLWRQSVCPCGHLFAPLDASYCLIVMLQV